MSPYEKYQIIISVAQLIIVSLGVFVALLQIQKMVLSIRISARSNRIQVMNSCTNRYQRLMQDLEDSGSEDLKSWWYAYWGVISDEFYYFSEGLLEEKIFEIWMLELAYYYNQAPRENWSIRSVQHKNFLRETLPDYQEQQDFFSKFARISAEENDKVRTRGIRKLIREVCVKGSSKEHEALLVYSFLP